MPGRKAATTQAASELDVDAWDAWSPEEAARRLAGVEAPWYVAAGWSVDLFLGGKRREHEDLEIAVPAGRFDEVARALEGFELYVPGREHGKPRVWSLDEAGERFQTHHQTWVLDPAAGVWRLDVFREPAEGDTWICRRDERIRLPYGAVIERTADGIPYCRPEITLLFKAKHARRARDKADFAAALPHLNPAQRTWLRESLALCHPGHPWLDALE